MMEVVVIHFLSESKISLEVINDFDFSMIHQEMVFKWVWERRRHELVSLFHKQEEPLQISHHSLHPQFSKEDLFYSKLSVLEQAMVVR
jgi:hypothetical protein